jgi:hypothetical protein
MMRAAIWTTLCLALGGCASPLAEPDRSRDAIASEPPATNGRPIIVTLKTRDADLTIESSREGPRFGVATAGGTERDLDVAALAGKYPDLYRLYRSAVVRSAPYLDARLDRPVVDDRHRR